MKKYWPCIIVLTFCSFVFKEGKILEQYKIVIPKLFKDNLLVPSVYTENNISYKEVELGRKLFFDPILSVDSTLSCASCHSPSTSFTDKDKAFSTGVDGLDGNRNSMALVNLAYMSSFFWDGRSKTLEEQALEPVRNPIEMHNNWVNVANKLEENLIYKKLFEEIYGDTEIDSSLVAKVITYFELTLISGDSKFDRYLNKEEKLTDAEKRGATIFMSESKGRCLHCHGGPKNPLYTDNRFHNNGLDSNFIDLGLAGKTLDTNDLGLFKTPTLRNLSFTAPYMHDGRFKTIDEVIDHYSEGIVASKTLDPIIVVGKGKGINLNTMEKEALKAFLLTLNDSSFVLNPKFSNPFENKK